MSSQSVKSEALLKNIGTICNIFLFMLIVEFYFRFGLILTLSSKALHIFWL
jgi:hypothetical protein